MRRNILIVALLALTTLAAYSGLPANDFVKYDDDVYVTANPHVREGLSLPGIGWAFGTFYASNWHPLTWISHMLDCEIFGLRPAAHHLVSALLHAASSAILFLVLRRMTGARAPSALVAALFALHPLHVESVAWVAERKDVLSGLFWMAALGTWTVYAEAGRRIWYLATLALFALGLLAKPMLVTLPFVLLLLDFWPLGRTRWTAASTDSESQPQPPGRTEQAAPPVGPERGRRNSTRPADRIDERGEGTDAATRTRGSARGPGSILSLVLEKTPFFALSLISCIVTFLAQRSGGAVAVSEKLPFAPRVANAFVSYARYLTRTLWPSGLSVFYPHPVSWPAWQVAASFVLVVSATALVILGARSRPHLAVGWLWYLGSLVPVIGLVQVGRQSMADRYTYIPLIGIFMAVAWEARRLIPGSAIRRIAAGAAAAFCLAGSMAGTWVQTRNWRDTITLFSHAIEVDPDNFVAHNGLGLALAAEGRAAEASEHYERALRALPTYSAAHLNLARLLLKEGRLDVAIAHLRRAVESKPDLIEARNTLALALVSKGDLEEAIAHSRLALALDPGYARAHASLACAFEAQGRLEMAIAEFETAAKLDPSDEETWMNLGDALAVRGRFEEAIDRYGRAARLDPGRAEPHYRRAEALRQLGRTEEARAELLEAQRLDPSGTPR